MSRITFQDVLDEAKISAEVLKEPCSEDTTLQLSNFCDPWNVVALHLKLNHTEIDDIDRDCKTTEEKRIKVLQKWREAFAFKATTETFVKALVSCGRADPALQVCKLFEGQK